MVVVEAARSEDSEIWSFCWRQFRRLQPVSPALVVLLIGVALYGHQWAAARPLWLDEEMIALNIRDRKFFDLPGALWLGQSAPLGWLMAQRVVILAAGASELTLRIVPVLFGMLTVAAAFWIGRRWLEPVAAAVLALLCTFSVYLFHYPFEVKHYSADTFWGLLLPGLAAWVVDHDRAGSPIGSRRRMVGGRGRGHWFANGALLVTPACALVLLVLIWRRDGMAAARRFALLGLIWLASFGLHYQLSIRYTHGSAFPARLLGARVSAARCRTDGSDHLGRGPHRATCGKSGWDADVDPVVAVGHCRHRRRAQPQPCVAVCFRAAFSAGTRRSGDYSSLRAVHDLDGTRTLHRHRAAIRSRTVDGSRCCTSGEDGAASSCRR